MKITQHTITIRDLVNGYADNGDGGVIGYGGKLDIRPPYQREFVYNEKQRDAVIQTVFDGFPLNTMYWAVKDNGTYEIIDGQQRTLSICQFFNGDFVHDLRYFHNLENDEAEKFLDYELMVYLCEGTPSEKLNWFRVVNISGAKLLEQELRNAAYAGPWLEDAKKKFSKSGCPAQKIADKYLTGSPIRQDYLETALKWAVERNEATQIETYMAKYQKEPNANLLWNSFQAVINWVDATFPTYRNPMKGINWNALWMAHGRKTLDTNALEKEISALIKDSEVTNKKGIWEYSLTHNSQLLQLRNFDEAIREAVYEKQQGICPICGKHFSIEQMDADHVVPWSRGGKTELKNCQMLCRMCNQSKSNR